MIRVLGFCFGVVFFSWNAWSGTVVRCESLSKVIPDRESVELVEKGAVYEVIENGNQGRVFRTEISRVTWDKLQSIPLIIRNDRNRMLIRSPSEQVWYYQEFDLSGNPAAGTKIETCHLN